MGLGHTLGVGVQSGLNSPGGCMPANDAIQERRSEYDVTNTVDVSSPAAVRNAVTDLFGDMYPQAAIDPLWLAFHDFERMFAGADPEYHGVDTAYHDIQHTLDMTLAMARLIAGHERGVEPKDRLGADRATLGLVTSLFHDAGYLRHRERDRDQRNGAQFTLRHVSRSSRFLGGYLSRIGLAHWSEVAQQIVHFTGYEINLDRLELEDPRDSTVGHLLGTADLIAQIADRCYLEKCRDRLFPEFVLGGIAIEAQEGESLIRYRSGQDLLVKTLDFYQNSARYRLEKTFGHAYRYIEVLHGGHNPYVLFIQKNMTYLSELIASSNWSKLRRRPGCFTAEPNAESRITLLAVQHLKQLARQNKIRLRGDTQVPLPATT
jgi:hypothetical protein